jgi:signal transduction histidine kinase
MASDQTADKETAPSRAPYFGLSGKLLLLTIMFVMIAEVLIYVPSIANFRLSWLTDRMEVARTVSVVLAATDDSQSPEGQQKFKLPDEVVTKILGKLGAKTLAIKMGNQRKLLAVEDVPHDIHHNIDLRTSSTMMALWRAMEAMFLCSDTDIMRVVDHAGDIKGADFIEIVIPEGPLRAAMFRFSRNILLLSLVISAITATLVYFALHYLFVRPMHRLTANMVTFREAPENPARIVVPSDRSDEIGIAERELGAMQRDLASMLQQKNHLAALGLAVSKINHDLRNLLASAQLFSDRLSGISDPTVQRFAPKLMHALERAIAFCQSTLSYGQVTEPPPVRKPVALEALVEEVRETVGLTPDTPIRWVAAVERGLKVDADPDQLFRVVLNLARNALQALETRAPNEPGRDQLRITGRREGAVAVIEVSDTGPGVAQRARLHLFEAFQGSTRPGGSGLGLAIAAELVRAHGGEIRLVDGTIGATFRVIIPDRAVELGTRRGERARA